MLRALARLLGVLMDFDDWYEANRERLSGYVAASAYKLVYEAAQASEGVRIMTEAQKKALQLLFTINCQIDSKGCDGPWCHARDEIRKAFEEEITNKPEVEEWNLQLPTETKTPDTDT